MNPSSSSGKTIHPEGELLLKAALLPVPQALLAWKSWLEPIDWRRRRIDPGSYALFPLICHNLGGNEAAAAMPESGRLRGIFRHTWASNETFLSRFDSLFKKATETGLEILLPDGLALARRFYPNHACRAIGRQTIRIRFGQEKALIRLARSLGWKTASRLPSFLAEPRNQMRRVWPLVDNHGTALLIRSLSRSSHDRELPGGGEPLDPRWERIRVMTPTRQILYLCRPAPRHAEAMELQILADCAMIIRSSAAALDWSVLRQTAASRIVLETLAGLGAEFLDMERPRE